MTRATGNRASFMINGLAATGACQLSATVQVSRDGVVDASFARDFVYGDAGAPAQPSRIKARQLRATKLQRVAP